MGLAKRRNNGKVGGRRERSGKSAVVEVGESGRKRRRIITLYFFDCLCN
jgi:hypothetical protein